MARPERGRFELEPRRTHQLSGGGVYVFNRNYPSIHTENGFEVPETLASGCTS